MTILVTGAAGFIGYHVCKALLQAEHFVIGLDDFNDYYDPDLKKARLRELEKIDQVMGFTQEFPMIFEDVSLLDKQYIQKGIFKAYEPDIVIHLAAQAGVRYSLENSQAYLDSNLQGFLNILDCCREVPPQHLIFASSSSVYGLNQSMPFRTSDHTDHPVSLYAASKKANEMMAHTYAHLFGIPCTGLRFFTVYGPWGRPDMAYYKFTKMILDDDTIDVYNKGDLMRDFTYVDDIVDGIQRLISHAPVPNPTFDTQDPRPDRSSAAYRLFNIGNNTPVKLMTFIETLEDLLGKKAKKNFLPMQPGDVYATYADIKPLQKLCGFEPKTDLRTGLERFVEWYRGYYRL
jgi:UDP-glucuronate 4-epimerase